MQHLRDIIEPTDLPSSSSSVFFGQTAEFLLSRRMACYDDSAATRR